MKIPALLRVGLAGALLACASTLLAQPFAWQKPQAEVLPNGDLKWTPEPFRFVAGSTVRYIDFAAGDDNASGDSKTKPWKHHPWDPAATGAAKTFAPAGPVTYVFKRGVEYRGRLVAPALAQQPATSAEPVRLTADPEWGTGAAALLGSERVTGWTRGGTSEMPESEKVWRAELEFAPRTLWLVGADGTAQRLPLARHPNWKETDPQDVMSEWPTWENPEWWKNNSRFHTVKVDGKDRHLGISKKLFTRPAADYVGATVWTEWGIVMGSPYPAKVEAFDEQKRGVAFRGPWTYEQSETIMTGNRFHLEDRAWMLDEPGEFWVEKKGQKSTVYFRPPGDADPNTLRVEAGRRLNFVQASQLTHLAISGLTFRFTNVHWDYNIPSWGHPDLKNGAIRLTGPAGGLTVDHCVFEHVSMAARVDAPEPSAGRIGLVRLADNIVRDTDHGAFTVSSAFGKADDLKTLAGDVRAGRVEHVDVLRNKLERVGFRIISGEHGHAVDLRFPLTSEMAGNFLNRIAGWGLAVFGGKPSGGGHTASIDAPLSRHLIHHNRVEDVLLKSNDWGGIETWQGGPFYVWSNLVINPRAYKNWTAVNLKPDGVPAFGHAYYFDGAFKNYLFNNIAQGRSSQLGSKQVNTSALQCIISFENTFFHNTFFRFANGTRQQEPSASRSRYLANVMEDLTAYVFRNADPKNATPDPNAAHYQQGGSFHYPTLGYARNVFFNTPGKLVFEETGVAYDKPADFGAALAKVKAQAASVGVVATAAPLRAPATGDFRPAPQSAALGQGVRYFVPWGLSGVVGEWNFVRNQADPAEIIDEHWYMHAAYGDRTGYKDTPRYPLTGVNVTADSYVAGPLDNWADGPGALKLNGRDQFLRIPRDRFVVEPPPVSPPATYDLGWATVVGPAQVIANQANVFTFTLKEPLAEGHRLAADLHWAKKDAFGGVNAIGGAPKAVDGQPNTFTISVKPAAKPGLAKYILTAYVTPKGWNEKTLVGKQTIDPGKAASTLTTADLRTVDIGTGDFLIELHLRAASADAVLLRKQETDDGPGYQLSLKNGRPTLTLRDAAGHSANAAAGIAINDGKWHHLVVEIERAAGIRFYVDGKAAGDFLTDALPAESLGNSGDFLVGGGPGLAYFAGELEFLRVARSTLAASRTTIQELYAWQFAGPQFSDFAGNPREEKSAAGALAR